LPGEPAVIEARVMRLERERNMLKLEMDKQRMEFEEERQACKPSDAPPLPWPELSLSCAAVLLLLLPVCC
jgi:hypothetical protein